MAAIIGALRAELSASIAQFQSDMGKAADSLKGFSRQAETIAKGLDRVGKQMSLAITAPLTLLAKAGLDEAKQAREAMGQVEAALESTGGASGKTAAELQKSAKELQNLSTFDDDDILRNVTANLLTFGNVQGQVFDRAQKSIIDLASRMGGDLQGAAIKVGRALNDPIKGMQALTRIGVSFTAAEQQQIKALVQHGDGLKAQGIILDALQQKFGGAAEAMRKAQPDAVLAQSWRDFKETIGAIELQLLPALTDKLKAVADWFNNLSPATQKFVVQAAALLATIGPVLVIFGRLIAIAGTLIPILKGLWLWFSGLSAVTLGWVAGLAAVALALVIFWKSVKDILHGDFAKAWEDAKDTASKIAKQITGIFSAVKGPTMPGQDKPGAPAATGQVPGKLNFNLDNEAEIKKAQDAAKTLQANIDKMQRTIAQGLDATHLPQATVQANALNAQLDDYVKTAKEAGVNTSAFSGKIDELRKRIAGLQAAGLEKEAKTFSRTVDQASVAVKRFAAGGLDPLSDKLDTVDSAYESLRDQIVKQIEDNAALADSNDTARAAMERLQKQLEMLEGAHAAATAAARSQFAAEETLADLQTKANNLETRNQIRDLAAASGRGEGPISAVQQQLQDANDELARKQIEVAQNLTKLEEQRDQAAAQGYDAEVDRLNSEIDLQTQLSDLVHQTTAEQLVASKRINSAFQDFTDSLTQNLTDAVANWRGDLQGLYGIFKQLASELFLKPVISAGSDALGGVLKSLASSFAGGFASGGYIPPGQWGIVGENGPEPAFGGAHGMTVQPRGAGGGVTQVFNISTPDANSFRMSQRQIARTAKQRLSL